FRRIDKTRDDLAHVVLHARIVRDDAVEVLWRIERIGDGSRCPGYWTVKVADNTARYLDSVVVILGEIVGDTGLPAMDVRAAHLFGRHDFPRRSLHEWRAAEKNGALPAHDDALIRHRRHVRAACGA